MTEQEIRDRLDDVTALALTAWAEARGDASEGDSSVEERIAVMSVIRTRARAACCGFKTICLAPQQFSCWNPGEDANHRSLLAMAERVVAHQLLDDVMLETLYLAEGVALGVVLDRVHRATHYYAPAAMRPAGRVPSWAVGREPVARVGRQVFHRL